MSAHYIGDFAFVTMTGLPRTIHQQLEIIQRSGVDGTGLFLAGDRGTPFTMRTGVDTGTREGAFYLFQYYSRLVGAGPVHMIHGGVQLTSNNAMFAVLDVRALAADTLMGKVGGLTPGGTGWLAAEWDLIPIHIANN